MRSALFIWMAIIFAGCTPEMEAKRVVKEILNDPDSAKFANLATHKGSGNVCGYVNAKNRMGGYVGNTPFFYRSIGIAAIVPPVRDRDFESLYISMRAGAEFSEKLETLGQQCRNVSSWAGFCGSTYPLKSSDICAVLLNSTGASLYTTLREKFDR